MNPFLQTLKSLGTTRLIAMGAVSLFLLGFLAVMVSRVTTPQMTLLYGNLEPPDANRMITTLEGQNIPYELQNNGRDIYVPGDQALRLRVQNASAVSGNASIGYEIFDNQNALGATNFIQDVNLLRALEGELSRTISSISGIKAARVHLVLPKREMFSRQQRPPSASVIIKLGGAALDPQQVASIQHLVAAAVPLLQPNQVNIVDDTGKLLARINDNPQNLLMTTAEELRRAQELKLTTAVEQLLAGSLGPGKVRAEVTVDMNFNRVVTNTESFDPNQAIPRSTVTVEEQAATNEQQPDTVSVAQNLPDAAANAAAAKAATNQSRTEETVNFEIARTVTNAVKEIGEIQRVSVAVLVDGNYTKNADGTATYAPRGEEEMKQIQALVRTAVGFDEARGDQVEVINMQFADAAELIKEPEVWNFLGFTRSELMRIAESLGVAVVAILVILLIVRPLISRAFESLPDATEAATAGRRLLEDGSEGQAALAGPGMAPAGAVPEEMAVEELIDIDKVEGRVKASSLKKIGEIVDKHPDEALNIVRNWLYAGGDVGG